MPARIVPASPEDLQAIFALDQSCTEVPHWTEAQYRAIISPPVSAQVTIQNDALKRCILAAKTANELTGYAVGVMVDEEAALETIAVSPAHRRAGIGRALCAAVVTWAWERDACRIELEVRASSAGPIALYRGLGFAITGRRTNYYAAPREDAVLMRLERSLN